jgi:hypothetical protein
MILYTKKIYLVFYVSKLTFGINNNSAQKFILEGGLLVGPGFGYFQKLLAL